MAAEDSPAFQFYVKEWRSSRTVQRMTFAERAMYFEMLCEQWEAITLPDDPQEVAALIATSDGQTAEIVAAWPLLRRKFATVEGQPGRIQNLRLERVRREKRAFIRGAKKGAKMRAAQAARTVAGAFISSTSRQPAGHQPVASSITSRAPADHQLETSTATASSSATASSTATARNAGRSAGQPPLALGLRRLKVWRWMLDDLIDTLGDHAETFGLDQWLQELDSRQKDVMPDGWPWLKTELITEARRRGLPMVESSDRKPLFTTTVEESGKAVLAILHRTGGVPR